MTDPIAAPSLLTVTAAGGITAFGVATGLDPALLFAGACGGLWSLSYMTRQTVLSGLHHVSLSSVIAAWSAPVVAEWLCDAGWLPEQIADGPARYALALGMGLIAVPVLGKSLMRFARRRLDSAGGVQ